MRDNHSLQGLCQTCSAVKGCAFKNGSVQPVWRCEEFGSDDGAIRMSGGRQLFPLDLETARDKGICSSCDSLSGCTFPQAGRGVVHCEEHLRST